MTKSLGTTRGGNARRCVVRSLGPASFSLMAHVVALALAGPALLARPPSLRQPRGPLRMVTLAEVPSARRPSGPPDRPAEPAPAPAPEPRPEPAPAPEPVRSPRRAPEAHAASRPSRPRRTPTAPERPTRRRPAPPTATPTDAPVVRDFSDLTLERRGAGGWNVPQGDGRGGSGVVGWGRAADSPGSRREPARPTGIGGAPPPAARRASPQARASDRSRAPRPPPGLRALLRRHYPPRARAVGAEGEARLRIRVSRDGTVSVLGVLPGSSPIFTDACRDALEAAGPFTPGRDRRGRAVATVLPFRCRFSTVY